MIGNGIRVHYHTEPVDSVDQAVSLAEYLNQHGYLAYKDDTEQMVVVPVESLTEDNCADKERLIHMLRSTWELFWEHSDKGLFGLPIYTRH